jgi:uroporphyrinogen-III decarboxylase
MAYSDGWAAVNLERPKRIPRVEFDASWHWDLVARVTGRPVRHDSPEPLRREASRAFIRAWNYDLFPGTMLHVPEIQAVRTQMGHAVYAQGNTDYVPEQHEAFADPEAALRLDPWEAFGKKDQRELVARFEKHYADACAENPDLVNTTGTYITLLTGLIYAYGWDMLLTCAGLDPDALGAVLNRYREWMQQYYDALAETSVPVIASHDDIVWTEGAIFHPDWYRTYIFPNLKKLYAPLIAAGKKVLFLSDGDYTEFVDDLVGCGVHGFFMEPLTDMRTVAEKYGKTHFFIGNADTRILLRGKREEIRAEVERCIAIGRDCPGFFLGVTNMIAPNTPVESALYYNECYEALSKRR